MVAMLAGLLFSLALIMALGTILLMGKAYHTKAMAALMMEHRPATRETIVRVQYSPARRPRFQTTEVESPTRAHRIARAA